MTDDIIYTGVRSDTSDYECRDGELDIALGVAPYKGTLRPQPTPKTIATLPKGCKVVFMHTTSQGKKNYIIADNDGGLFWRPADAVTPPEKNNSILPQDGTTHVNVKTTHVSAVGNTLIVFTAKDMNYILWKDGKYTFLGTHLPETDINFSLLGHPRFYSINRETGNGSANGTFRINFDAIPAGGIYQPLSEENKKKITAQVMAKVNRFVRQQTVEKGRFCFPFFVRYAYRLFDGTHTMQSAPVLMMPSTTSAVVVPWYRAQGKGSYNNAEMDIMLVAAELEYRILENAASPDMHLWSDIIQGIDIYISKPIYTYDQSGEIESFNDFDNFLSRFIGRIYRTRFDESGELINTVTDPTEDRLLGLFADLNFTYQNLEYTYAQLWQMFFSKDRTTPDTTMHLPEFSEDKQKESIEAVSTFYKLATIDFKDITPGEITAVKIDDGYLETLTNRPTLEDDYLSHDSLTASYAYAYNRRINLAGVKRTLFGGFRPAALFPLCQNIHSFTISNDDKKITITPAEQPTGQSTKKIRIFLRENGKEYTVDAADDPDLHPLMRRFVQNVNRKTTYQHSDGFITEIEYDFKQGTKTTTKKDSSGSVALTKTEHNTYYEETWGSWLFYPNPAAYRIDIYENGLYTFSAELKPHPFLNGAYAFLGFRSQRQNNTQTLPSANDGPSEVNEFNKIYTSEAGNPFLFPLGGINTVGTGDVIALAAATKALSQGQYGQFPLYAFTTDGVWALQTADNGLYSSIHAVTRDVCINPASVTQTDNAVIFATARGIIVLSGASATCISDPIRNAGAPALAQLPGINAFLRFYDGSADNLTFMPFGTFIKDCRIIYDYANRRLIVFHPEAPYAYVYAIDDSQWGMLYARITSAVNSYPDAIAMNGSSIIDMGQSETDVSKAFIVTRPFKFGNPGVMKSVDTVIQRGIFHHPGMLQVLYATTDYINYFPVHSSSSKVLTGMRGGPYKAYRLVLILSLNKADTLYGFSASYTPRLTNRLR
ncbi:MAG: hypothetical protein SOY69_05075 [Alloprevotella sp.]|nr:hypothetical protein [Alloprevotella sp.]